MASSDRSSSNADRFPYGALADSRRRCALDALVDADSPMTVAALAAAVASRELDEPDANPDWDRMKQVQLSLYHHHAPYLDDLGVVEFDADDNTVALADDVAADVIEDVLP